MQYHFQGPNLDAPALAADRTSLAAPISMGSPSGVPVPCISRPAMAAGSSAASSSAVRMTVCDKTAGLPRAGTSSELGSAWECMIQQSGYSSKKKLDVFWQLGKMHMEEFIVHNHKHMRRPADNRQLLYI